MRDFERVVGIVRYGLLGAVVLFVLWVGYGASANRRWDIANGVPGELLAGENVGQSFVARYDGLAGVEVHIATIGLMTDANRSAIVWRLRLSEAGVDIASGTIEPGQALEPDPWYLFKFAPIADSRGKKYFLVVEAPEGVAGKSMSLFWYQPGRRGDPYLEGAAYRNSEPTPGDIAFGLRYEASLLQVWGGMIGEAGESTSGLVLWALLIVAGGGAIFLVGPGWKWLEGRGRRWGIGVALGVGLVHGLLYMLIMPPWQGPDEYAHYAYAALLDRHDLDIGAIEGIEPGDTEKDIALVRAINASADRNDFTRRLRGNGAPGAPTRTDTSIFQQVRQPPTYYWLCALGLRAARLVGIPADPVANPDAALYVMRAVSVILSLLVIGMAWLALGTKVAIGVALLPMHAFVGSMINNDILAEVAVSALVLAVIRLLKTTFDPVGDKWPSRRELVLAGICVVIAGLGVATKTTAPAAAIPLLVGGLAVWVWVGVARTFGKGWNLKWGMWVAGVAVIGVGAFFVLIEQRGDASAGWFRSYVPLVSAQRVETATAHEGGHVIQLEAVAGAKAIQRVVPPFVYHPALRVTLAGWVRLEAGPGEIEQGPVVGQLAVMDGVREAGFAFTTLDLTGRQDWTRLEVTGEIQNNAEQIELILGVREGNAPGARVQFDDLSIKVEEIGAAWSNPIYRVAIVDPSGEQARWALRPLFERVLPDEAGGMVGVMLNPQPFSKIALWADYGRAQWRSFWGSFGWLSIDLPEIAYAAIGVLVLLACGGLALRGIRERKGGWGWQGWMASVAGLSLVVAIGVGFAKQAALTAYGGLPSAPQGRYLFVLIIPVVWLLGAGLGSVIERLPAQGAKVAKLVLMDLLVMGAIYCLLALVVPYFYG